MELKLKKTSPGFKGLRKVSTLDSPTEGGIGRIHMHEIEVGSVQGDQQKAPANSATVISSEGQFSGLPHLQK